MKKKDPVNRHKIGNSNKGVKKEHQRTKQFLASAFATAMMIFAGDSAIADTTPVIDDDSSKNLSMSMPGESRALTEPEPILVTSYDELRYEIEKATSDPEIKIKLADTATPEDAIARYVINVVDKYVTVDGKVNDTRNNTLISDGLDHRAFVVNRNSSLTLLNTILKDFTIVQGYSPKEELSGGVIYSEGALTIENLTLDNNSANYDVTDLTKIVTGGAIYSANGSLDVKNSTFSNNYARRGGAISTKDFSNVTVNIQNSTFVENSAVVGGGAISNGAFMLVVDSIFKDNYLTAEISTGVNGGGAIRNIGSLTLRGNNLFQDNAAYYNGGAIFSKASANSADILIEGNVSFIGNKTVHSVEGDQISTTGGGAIHNDDKIDFGTVLNPVSDIQFKANTTKGSGGAIFNDYNGILHIFGTSIFGGTGTGEGNVAAGSGGAIYNNGILNLSSQTGFTQFLNNSAGMYGGALRNSGTLRLVGKTLYDSNRAGIGGGAISNVGSFLLDGNAIFRNNVASQSGGAIYNVGNLYILGSAEFDSNSANCSTAGGDSQQGGGAIFNLGGDVVIIASRDEDGNSSISFNNNNAYKGSSISGFGDGGAIFIAGDGSTGAVGNLYLYGADFYNNSAHKAGAIRTDGVNDGQYANSYVNNARFIDNKASTYGGAMGSGGDANMVIYDSYFEGNSIAENSTGFGGAVTNGNLLYIINSEFYNNRAGSGGSSNFGGGAIGFDGKVLRLIADGKDTIFSGNTSLATGLANNALYLRQKSMLPYVYLNAGNGGDIIFNDTIFSSGIKSVFNINLSSDSTFNTRTGEDLSTYYYYAPNADTASFDRVVMETPTHGTVQLNDNVTNVTINLYDGILHVGADPSKLTEGMNYFSSTNINLYGGTLNFINSVANKKESDNNNKIGFAQATVYGNTSLQLDVDLTNNAIDYIDTDLNFRNNAQLTIDKLLFQGMLPEEQDSVVLQFLRKNSGYSSSSSSSIVLLDSLKTVITSSGGYGLSLVRADGTAGAENALQILRKVNAGGLPVAVSIGEFDDVSTYVYTALEHEVVSNWDKEFRYYDGENYYDRTASNVLKGDELYINGNKLNVVSTDTSLEGIIVSDGQKLVINDVGTSVNGVYQGWEGFNSALINNGGNLEIRDSVFKDNASTTNGGAVRNIGGIVDVTNTRFLHNTADGLGGAIYNANSTTDEGDGNVVLHRGMINIIANNTAKVDYFFNQIGDEGHISSDDIYNKGGLITVSADATSTITFNDKITGEDFTYVDSNGDTQTIESRILIGTVENPNRGEVIFNDTVSDTYVVLNSGTLSIGKADTTVNDDHFSDVNLILRGGNLSLQNDLINKLNVNNLEMEGTTTLLIDVDLSADNLSDQIMAATLSGEGEFNIGRIRFTNDMDEDVDLITAEFINQEVLSSIQAQNKSISYNGTVYSVDVENNLLTITRVGNLGDFPYEVAVNPEPERTYQIGSNDTHVKRWINGNNRLIGTSFYIMGSNDGYGIDGNNLPGIVLGRSTTNVKQFLNLTDVASYRNFDGAFVNTGATIEAINSTFEENHSSTTGGVFTNYVSWGVDQYENPIVVDNGIIAVRNGGTFRNNSAVDKGGAFYNEGTLHLITKKGETILFEGNTAAEGNDIYQTDTGYTLISASTGGDIILNGGIAGSGSIDKLGEGNLYLNGDNSGFTGNVKIEGGIVNGENELFTGETIVGVGAKFFTGNTQVGKTTLKWYTNNDFDYSTGGRISFNDSRLIIGNGEDDAQFTFGVNDSFSNTSRVTINKHGNFITQNNMTILGNVFGEGTFTADNANIVFASENSSFYGDYIQNGAHTTLGGQLNMNSITVNDGDIIFGDDALYNSNPNSYINLNNANLFGNIELSSIDDTYDLHITGNTTINGNVGRAVADLSGDDSVLKIANNAFSKVDSFTANAGTIDVQNNLTEDILIKKLVSDPSVKYKIDVDLTNGEYDKIITTNDSSGTIFINAINDLGTISKRTEMQVLRTQNSDLQIALDGSTLNIVSNELDTLANDVTNTTVIHQEEGLSLGTTDTTNDTIIFQVDKYYDILAEINRKNTTEDRSFTFVTNDEYDVTENLGKTSAGKFDIIGSGVSGAVIDLNEFTGFEIDKITQLNISDIEIKASSSNADLITVNNTDANIQLNNVTLNGNINSSVESYTLGLTGNIVLAGTVGNANATLTGSDSVLKINTNSLANANLTANEGTIDFQNSALETTFINSLSNSDTNSVKIKIDLEYNATGNKSDMLSIANADSNATVIIDAIEYLTAIDTETLPFTTQVIDSPSSDISISLSSNVQTEYNLGTITDSYYLLNPETTRRSEIADIIYSSDDYDKYDLTGSIKGNLEVIGGNSLQYSTSTSYDSQEVTKVHILEALNQKESRDRVFRFVAEAPDYSLFENAGVTGAGNFDIQGIAGVDGEGNPTYSVIDFGARYDEDGVLTSPGYSGFVVKNGSNIDFQNVSFENLYNDNYSSTYKTDGAGAVTLIGASASKITGQFKNNALNTADITIGGGALSLYTNSDSVGSSVEQISADFINNTSKIQGGAIYVDSKSSINKISNSNFVGNKALSGAAIYDKGGITEIINSNFIDNIYSVSNGAAIYRDNLTPLKITADNGTSTFRGNRKADSSDYTAIRSQKKSDITLNAINNGVITFNDAISGLSGFKVYITGDETGVINFINGYDVDGVHTDTKASLEGANIYIQNGVTANFKYDDNYTNQYSLTSLNITDSTMNLGIDVDYDNNLTDTFSIKNNSTGTISIDNINFINPTNNNVTKTYKILDYDSAVTSFNQLELTKTKYVTGEGVLSRTSQDEVTADIDVLSNDQLRQYSQSGDIYSQIELAKTTNTNDSIKITYGLEDYNGEIVDEGSLGDTLYLWNTSNTGDTKNFNFTSENQTYNSLDNVGSSTAGTLNINGYSDGNSVLNIADKTGFELDNDTNLNFNNIHVTATAPNSDLVTVRNANAKVSLNNTVFTGNIIGDSIGYDLALTGNTSVNGTVDNAVNIDLQNTTLDTITIDNLVNSLGNDVNINIDLDTLATGNKSDILSLGSTSNANIIIKDIDYINGHSINGATEAFSAQILDTTSSNVTLSLDDSIQKVYNFEDLTDVYYILKPDTTTQLANISDSVLSTDDYDKYTQEYTAAGVLNIIGNNLDYSRTTVLGTLSIDKVNTLEALNQKVSTDRLFKFVEEAPNYTIGENAGVTGTGNFKVQGISGVDGEGNPTYSVIDFGARYDENGNITDNGYLGFVVKSGATAEFTNVSFENFYNDSLSSTYRTTGAGVITVDGGTVSNITGQFANNSLYEIDNLNNGSSAITVYSGQIDNISANFVNNSSASLGGAIYNEALIDTISNSTFTRNSSSLTSGGAIYNSGTINTISGVTFANNIALNGAAIYNIGNIGEIINSNFYDNISLTGASAIYHEADNTLKITADNGTSTFRGNHKLADNDYSAIYIVKNTNSNVTLNAVNNGIITFNGAIDGSASGYKVNFTGDSTGSINFINGYDVDGVHTDTMANLEGADLTIDGGVTANFGYNDNYTNNYTLNRLTITDGTMNLGIDVDYNNNATDTLSIDLEALTSSTKTININNINFISMSDTPDTVTYQILTQSSGNQLALSKTKYITGEGVLNRTLHDDLTANINVTSNDQIRQYSQSGDLYNEIALATTTTANDSIQISYAKEDYNGAKVDIGSYGDTLTVWNTETAGAVKNFNFTSANQTYLSSDNVGSSTAGKLNINGYSDGTSVLDINDFTGFTLDNITELNFNNLKIKGTYDDDNIVIVNNADAKVGLNNVYLQGDIKSNVETFDLTLQGNTTIAGTIDKANATLTGTDSVLKVQPNSLSNVDLTANEGTIDLSNSDIRKNFIGSLSNTDTNSVKINIDVDPNQIDSKSDTLVLGSSSNATVVIDDINYINSID